MAVLPEPWKDLHEAMNDLTAAKLLLHRAGEQGRIDVPQIEALIMQAASKIDELSLDDLRVAVRPGPAPARPPEALRKVLERQAKLHEEAAQLLERQAALVRQRAELAALLASEKREEAALTPWEPDRQRVEREVPDFERELRILACDIEVLEAHRQRALAQAATARQKGRAGGGPGVRRPFGRAPARRTERSGRAASTETDREPSRARRRAGTRRPSSR